MLLQLAHNLLISAGFALQLSEIDMYERSGNLYVNASRPDQVWII